MIAITILAKTTHRSDRSMRKPSYTQVQKLFNDKAIAIFVKTTHSRAIAHGKSPVILKHKSYPMIKR
ncbi:MAG: hypothetical protein KME38_00890 [Spirirestis rafaelensis WJT71-NPBG6]|jgi:hypothetical protein|nr:hypothetical protein [Spirirestis rafaelensis WJT71-NPBG6]